MGRKKGGGGEGVRPGGVVASPGLSPPTLPFLGYINTCAWHLQAAAVAGAQLQAGPGPPAPAGRVRHRHGGRRFRQSGPHPPADCKGRWSEP